MGRIVARHGVKWRWLTGSGPLAALGALTVVAAAGCGASNHHSASPPSTSTTVDATSQANQANSSAAVSTLLKQGLSQAQAKQLGQAETTFKNVLLLDPENVYALYNLGVIDQTQNNTAGAIAYYNKALNSNNTYTPAMYNKAIILEATDLEAALALYKQIVAINPKASTAYLRMAFVYAKQGQDAKADQARAKAIALDASLSKYPLPAKCSRPNC
jgi:tetratricopeptide (TPR) repeat protein